MDSVGLKRAIPLDSLKMFTLDELDLLLNGELEEWTEESLTRDIKTKISYRCSM